MPDITAPLSNFAQVKSFGGRSYTIPIHQLPAATSGVIANTWFFNAVGNYNLALQNPGTQQIKIDRGSGSGKTTGKVWVRLLVQNTSGSPVYLVPGPFLFTNLQLQTPGGDIINTWDPLGWWLSILGTTSEENWASLSDLLNASNDYESAPPIQAGATKDIWIPLPGNVFSTGEVATRVIQGDTMAYLNFAPPSTTVLSGPTNALTVNNLALVFEMQQLDNQLIIDIDREYMSFPHSFYYPFMRVMNFTQSWNVNSQYTLQLSGITGGVGMMFMALRASAQGEDCYHGLPITDFQIQNQEGIAITGASFIPEAYNRWAQLARWYLGTWMQNRRFYGWVFGSKDSAAVEFMAVGKPDQVYGFSGNEQLVLDTAPAGTNEALTLTVGAAVTVGSVQFGWTTPNNGGGGTAYSVPVNLATATNAQIVTAIEDIFNFEGTVAVTGGPFSATGTVTVTFSGNYGNRPLFNEGYFLTVLGVVNAGINVVNAITVPGVRGITNGGTYTLTVIAFTPSIMSVSAGATTSGRLSIQNA